MSAVPMAVEQHSYCSLNSVLSSLLILYYNRTSTGSILVVSQIHFRFSTHQECCLEKEKSVGLFHHRFDQVPVRPSGPSNTLLE